MIRSHVKPLRLGMVGGGIDSMIGETHRMAARLDNSFSLVAGCLSSTPDRALASAQALGLDPARSYTDYTEMARAEAAREDGIDAVTIVTPNHLHFPVAKAFLSAGIHVICDKPLTSTLEDALALQALVHESDCAFFLTHNYSAYPMVRLARQMVEAGEIGALRIVHVEYPQDWLSLPIEQGGHKQADWRTDPTRSGLGGTIADIGTHAYQLARYVTQAKPSALAADLCSLVGDRTVDDNATILMRYANGARGLIWVSQVASGEENNIKLRVYGDKGSLEWSHEQNNLLIHKPLNAPMRRLSRAGAGSTEKANATARSPAGHPEGYLDGFAALYYEIAAYLHEWTPASTPPDWLPGIQDGVEGMAFIDASIRSSQADTQWIKLE